MKCVPYNIINFIKNNTKNVYPILFYGNEGSLISGLIKEVYDTFQKQTKNYNIKTIDYKNDKEMKLETLLNSTSLFSEKNFVIIKNPQENILVDLNNIKTNENVLVINAEGIRSKSKIKSFFDNHQHFISVPCYQLDKNYIKKIVDEFINNNNIVLHKEVYWFLIENISDDYITLKSELEKLSIFNNSSINLKMLQELIVQKNNYKTDNIFFNCVAGNSSQILKEMNSSGITINESYEILISLKKFIYILSSAVVNKDGHNLDQLVTRYLPKYLFLKKNIFKETLKKTNLIKINKITKLLQKAEYLLRKNTEQHKEILERLLLNLTKTMK